jgi:fructose-1-phosphate kinase PfkB-like protein
MADGVAYRVHPPKVEEVSDLGCGDSMVAGLCWAAGEGYDGVDCLRWAAACGAANAAVWNPGEITRAEVERLLPEVGFGPL